MSATNLQKGKRAKMCQPVLLLVGCLVAVWANPACAQFAKQVVDAVLQDSSSTAAAAAFPEVSVQFFQPGVRLPSCPASNILQSNLGVPDNWHDLSIDQQAANPIHALIIQLAYSVWQNDPASKLGGCLSAMGIDTGSIRVINRKVQPYGGAMTALVMRAGSKAVYVVFRGTDFEDPRDVLVDADCHHTANVKRQFGAWGRQMDLRLHTGFYSSWQALEADVTAAIEQQLQQVDDNKRVYFIGHSLGGALAAIGALRMRHVWNNTINQVAGVWLYGAPRIGNEYWQREYDRHLLTRTVRMVNYADFASRLPMQTQICPLTHLNGTFTFRHIGRSVLLCPDRATGLVNWKLAAHGSEVLDCGVTPQLPDLSLKTHWLGSYMDTWRRGYTQVTGQSLANDARMLNAECDECSFFNFDQNKQVNMPARAGGPVTCAVNANCNIRVAWDAVTKVGSVSMKAYSPLSICLGYLCT